MSTVTSQHKDPQKYKMKVLGIIPCKCRPVSEAVCRDRSVTHCGVLCVREHDTALSQLEHCTFLPWSDASRPADHKTMTLKVTLSLAAGFYYFFTSKGVKLKLGKL